RENQALAWVLPSRLSDYPLLAADRPIVTALRLSADYVFTPPGADENFLLSGLQSLPLGALLRLRLPPLSDADYAVLARRLAPHCREIGLHLMLDRDPALAAELGAGWHARAARLRGLHERPVPASCWFGASIHDVRELEMAAAASVDFLVLGPVRATRSHPAAAALGWERFAALAQRANRPVYAIGGTGPADHARAFGHYAQGVAGISAYWREPSS
ncbi:MAG: thiamine phosphate synthase, partial [Stenotrophobium sp.]